jgi:D-erythronate 2-dehydrogenase
MRNGYLTPSVSDKIAAIAREPLAGRDFQFRLDPSTLIPVASSRAVSNALIQLHDLPFSLIPRNRAMNFPALTVTVAEMISTVERKIQEAKRGRLTFVPNQQLQHIVDRYPKHLVSRTASELCIKSDASFEEIVDIHLSEVTTRIR